MSMEVTVHVKMGEQEYDNIKELARVANIDTELYIRQALHQHVIRCLQMATKNQSQEKEKEEEEKEDK